MSLTWPNLLSAFRIALIPLFVIAVLDGRSDRALLLFAIAGLTDLLDGIVARFLGQQSVLGAYLDPMADKLLLTSAFILLAIPGIHPGVAIPIALTVLVIARDILIVLVALAVYLAFGIARFPPSLLGKLNTVFQIVGVVIVLATGVVPGLELAARITIVLVFATTIVSGLEYGYRFIYRADRLSPAADPEDR